MIRRRHELQQRMLGVTPETIEVVDVQRVYPVRQVPNVGQDETIRAIRKNILGSHSLVGSDQGWLTHSHNDPTDALTGRKQIGGLPECESNKRVGPDWRG